MYAQKLQAAEGGLMPWSPAIHRMFPSQFKDAAKVLLLCKHRARSLVAAAQEQGGCGAVGQHAVPAAAAALDSLPDELLHLVLCKSAYPLEAWIKMPEGYED